ncbi:mitochondrial 50S ribosomal protein L28-like protein [Hysterangium stoloniferum]|nr:mitochondrial 50S ribosomal protein L28-like protein [Hysterangium stoloniferum]
MFPTRPSFAALPYSHSFKRAALGLFHGKTKIYGNSVPFSMHKTRRSWLPNSHNKALYSELMGTWIRTTVTARTLRCIDKVGGVDNYLLNTKPELLGYEGMRLRVMVRERRRQLEAEGMTSGTGNISQQKSSSSSQEAPSI